MSEKRDSQKLRILALLKEAGPRGVTNLVLNAVCFRYGGRIHELRKEGYKIKTVRESEQEFRFVLEVKGQQSLFAA